jgi:hypothetical protein
LQLLVTLKPYMGSKGKQQAAAVRVSLKWRTRRDVSQGFGVGGEMKWAPPVPFIPSCVSVGERCEILCSMFVIKLRQVYPYSRSENLHSQVVAHFESFLNDSDF